MTLLSVGLNYNTSPFSIREQLSFSIENLKFSLQDLCSTNKISEAVILSTCNRTELYCASTSSNYDVLVDWVAEHKQVHADIFAPYLYSHTNSSMVRHLFRVASGLDSMILGEPQILGQIKKAYQAAEEAGTLGNRLTKLFEHTFTAAKKVRTDTDIGTNSVSVAYAAVQLSQQVFADLSEQTALLIGAGETIELVARHLSKRGIGKIIIANRTVEKAHDLAMQFDGQGIALSELSVHLAKADIIISSTASQLPILGKGRVESALKIRKRKPMFIVDLAVPRDIESEVGQLSDVYLYTVDDLKNIIDQNINARRQAAEQAEAIIDTQIDNYFSSQRAQGAKTTIQDYRIQSERTRDDALLKALVLLNNGLPAEEVLNRLAHSLTNKLIHTPCTQIRAAAQNDRQELIVAAREIFNLAKC
jgi:glutamyl-tRNA reductase